MLEHLPVAKPLAGGPVFAQAALGQTFRFGDQALLEHPIHPLVNACVQVVHFAGDTEKIRRRLAKRVPPDALA